MNDWKTITRNVAKDGLSYCDVSHLFAHASELREDGHGHASELVAAAARDVLRHRRMATKRMADLISRRRPAKLGSDVARLRPTMAERIAANHQRRRIAP